MIHLKELTNVRWETNVRWFSSHCFIIYFEPQLKFSTATETFNLLTIRGTAMASSILSHKFINSRLPFL